MKTKIPTLKDFSSDKVLTLDEKEAVDHFLGKTLDEAKQLFIENDLYYAGDFMWMGKKAFQYYFPACIDYFMSKDPNTSSDILNHFVSLIKFKIEYEIETIKLCKSMLLNVLEYCEHNYSKFDIDIGIYGDLKSEVSEILELIKKL